MIPKIIHCFWAGGPKTKLAEKCLASWRKFAPGWEIVEWNLETRRDPPQESPHEYVSLLRSGFPSPLGSNARFLVGAVKNEKWAFVSDWVRFAVLKEHGGVYFDFDQELVKPISELPEREWVASLRLPSGKVDLAPGAIALEKGSPVAQAMLDFYATAEFDQKLIVGEVMEKRFGGLEVLEPDVMCPLEVDGTLKMTEKTIGIHWFAFSWGNPYKKFVRWLCWHGFRPLVDLGLRLKKILG